MKLKKWNMNVVGVFFFLVFFMDTYIVSMANEVEKNLFKT